MKNKALFGVIAIIAAFALHLYAAETSRLTGAENHWLNGKWKDKSGFWIDLTKARIIGGKIEGEAESVGPSSSTGRSAKGEIKNGKVEDARATFEAPYLVRRRVGPPVAVTQYDFQRTGEKSINGSVKTDDGTEFKMDLTKE